FPPQSASGADATSVACCDIRYRVMNERPAKVTAPAASGGPRRAPEPSCAFDGDIVARAPAEMFRGFELHPGPLRLPVAQRKPGQLDVRAGAHPVTRCVPGGLVQVVTGARVVEGRTGSTADVTPQRPFARNSGPVEAGIAREHLGDFRGGVAVTASVERRRGE